ncbi:MAG: sugar ABC transporter permease [Lachnospiraceae bacterium]|nr:sugar ABC transporter permease [Lachnospiraceae bacterium]
MKKEEVKLSDSLNVALLVQRILTVIVVALVFFPFFNPARICGLISDKISIFTAAISYTGLTDDAVRALMQGWVDETVFLILYAGALLALIGIIGTGAGACMSLGNIKFKRLGALVSLLGAVVEIVGYIICFISYNMLSSGSMTPAQFASKLERKIVPIFPTGVVIYGAIAVIIIILSLIVFFMLPKADKEEPYEMESKYKLFLMFLPFAFLAFLFCYLPLYGWRYAFFDYNLGESLSASSFVGMKWFTYLFKNEATRDEMVRVIVNTLGISGLNVVTQWLPMVFAVFLCEMKSLGFRRFVQAFTTIPNFISWVLVYAVALSIFSTDGFINTFSKVVGILGENEQGQNYLMGDSHTWIKMWAWGTWKGVGWSAIIYIAGIAGIDQSLYEAATVDGAGRFQKIWHITMPGLLPTFFVLLLMAIAGILSNGLDQYLVFSNADNIDHINVLDLYVYNLGLGDGNIPLSTVVGMFKSVISVILLFSANALSKALRGESIV